MFHHWVQPEVLGTARGRVEQILFINEVHVLPYDPRRYQHYPMIVENDVFLEGLVVLARLYDPFHSELAIHFRHHF